MNKEIEELLKKKEEELQDINRGLTQNEHKICLNCQHFFKGQCRKSLDPSDYVDVSPLSTCGSFFTEGKDYCFNKEYEDIKKTDIKNGLRKEIYNSILMKDKASATEKLAELFKLDNWVFALRDDDKDEVWIYNNGIYEPNGISYIKEFVRKMVGEAYTTNFANIIIEKIKADCMIDSNSFFNQIYKDEIPLWNGILNIRTRKLSHFIPERIFFSKVPIDYKPSAKPKTTIEFFKSILEDEEDIAVLQEWFGYCLYKDYQIEKAVMLYGKGRNGKGQLLELMKRFVGFNNCSSVSLNRLIDENSFNVAELHNKLINIGGDIDGTYLEKVGMFQQLTGNDMISAKRKFKNDIKFTNHAKLIFACNNLPRPGQTSDGFWDRWILLKFPFKFVHQELYDMASEEDRELLKIRKNNIIEDLMNEEEMSGLLNWALDGLDRLLKKGHFTLTKSILEVKDRWIKVSNSLIPFCDECLEEEYGAKITKDDFRRAYNDYCIVNRIEPLGDKAISNYLTKKFGVSSDKEYINEIDENGEKTYKQVYFWKGIKFIYSLGGLDSQGFSIYIKKVKLYIGENTLTNLNTLTTKKTITTQTIDDKDKILDIFDGKSTHKINELYENYDFNPENLERAISELKEEGILAEIKPGEFVKL